MSDAFPEHFDRSVEHVEHCLADGKPALRILCDCGTTTVLILERPPGTPGLHEFAWTCDGCHTVRWCTVTAT